MGQDFYTTKILPHAGIIIKICRAYTHSRDDFEDYYQEVCLQIWRSRENFNQQCAWTTWLYKIALNVCLTLVKTHKHKNNIACETTLQEPVYHHEDDEHRGSIDALYQAIHQLNEVDRAIIVLYLEQHSNQDIANIIGITANNTGVRIARIKKQLSQLMNLEE